MVSINYLKRYMVLKRVNVTVTSKTYEITEDNFSHPYGVITIPFKVSEQQLLDWLLDVYRHCKTGEVFKRFLNILTEVKGEIMDITKIPPSFVPKAVEFFKLDYETLGKGWYRHIYKNSGFYLNNIKFYFEVFTELKLSEGVRQMGIIIWDDKTTYGNGVIYPCPSIKPQKVLKLLQSIFGEQIEVLGLFHKEDDINN